MKAPFLFTKKTTLKCQTTTLKQLEEKKNLSKYVFKLHVE